MFNFDCALNYCIFYFNLMCELSSWFPKCFNVCLPLITIKNPILPYPIIQNMCFFNGFLIQLKAHMYTIFFVLRSYFDFVESNLVRFASCCSHVFCIFFRMFCIDWHINNKTPKAEHISRSRQLVFIVRCWLLKYIFYIFVFCQTNLKSVRSLKQEWV